MNIEGNVVAAVLSFLAALGAGIGWWVDRRDRHKDPLPKSAAEVAVAKEALGVVVAAAEWDRTRGERIQTDLTAALRRITALEEDGVTDRARITRLETLLSHAASYIEALLRWAHALRDAPKPPPLPTELHDLVDPQLWITISNPKET